MSTTASPRGVRIVATLEAAKALLVLMAGFGLLGLVHRDLPTLAAKLVSRLHLNAANKYPRIFIDAADHVTDSRLWFLASMAMVYAAFRGVEAYGLWNNRPWAAWLALVTGGMYLPFEVYELTEKVTWVRFGALIVNVLVVVYMAYDIRWSKRPEHLE